MGGNAPVRRRKGRKLIWTLATLLVLGGAGTGWWLWKNQGLVRPAHVPYGFVGDTVLVHGRSTELPGDAKELPASDRSLFLRGVALQAQGETVRAGDIYEDLMRRQPSFGASFYYAAQLRLAKNARADSAMADTLVLRGLVGDPGHPWLLLQSAKLHQARGRTQLARIDLEKALDFAPDFRQAMEELARLELKVENFPRAQRLAQLAVSLAKGNASARYDLVAEVLFAREKDDSAQKALEKGIELNPKESRYLWLRGLMAESKGDTVAARKDYQQALQMGRIPEAEEALRTLGLKPLHGKGRFGVHSNAGGGDQDFALEVLLPLSRAYPTNAPLWYSVGRAYCAKGLYAQADEYFQKALSMDSTVPGLREWWSQNRINMEEKAKLFNTASSKTAPLRSGPDNGWYDLGHYRLPWGSSRDGFLGQFPAGRFESRGQKLVESRVMWGIRHVHESFFDAKGLWSVRVIMADDGKSGIDLMEEGIRLNVLQAGSGTFLEPTICPSLGQVDAVVWENTDTYEIMVKAGKVARRLFLLRLKPDRVPEGGTCALAGMAADTTR